MAKVDPNTFLGKGGQSSFGGVAAAVVSPLANANAKALNNISKGLSGLDQNLRGLLTIQQTLLKDRKRKEVLDRRKSQRERDRQREEEIESMSLPKNAGGLARGGELKGKEKSWAGQLFKSLFGGLEFLLAGALKFLITLGTFAAVRTILQIVGNPANRQKLETFFTKLQFVWNKISGFASWLVQDNLLDGFTSLFGEKSTFGERLQGLGKILIGIIGLKLLLDPFGLIFGVLDLLNAREAKARAQQAGPGGPGGPGGPEPPKRDPRLERTRKRDIILKRDKLSRIKRLRQSLSRIKAKRYNLMDVARVTAKRPGRAPGLVAGLAKQTPRTILNGFKGLYRGVKGFVKNIPVVGMLLNFAFETLDVDEQGNLKLDLAGKGEHAAYKTIGMGLGAAAGSIVPVVGNIIGAVLGEYGGSLIYHMVKGASTEQVIAMMKQDAQNTFESMKRGAQGAWTWVTGAYDKFYSGLPKTKLPDNWILGPLSGVEVPDVIKIGEDVFKYAYNFVSGLFGGDVEPGKVTPLIQNPFQRQPEIAADPSATQSTSQEKIYAILCYGTNDWGLSQSAIKARASGMIQDLMGKGYVVVVVPPNKNLKVDGKVISKPHYAVLSAARASKNVIVELGTYDSDDTLHLTVADAKRIHSKYKPAVYVGDSNAVRIKGAMTGNFANTATAVSRAGGQDIQGQIDSSVPSVEPKSGGNNQWWDFLDVFPNQQTPPESGEQPQSQSSAGYAQELFDIIGRGEGDYNSINNGTAGDRPGGAKRWVGKNLTDMTLNELMEFQKSKIWAAGKYQIIPDTMKGFVTWLRGKGYNPATTKFSEQIQELFPNYVLESKRPAVAKYLRGQASIEEANVALAAEFASVGVPYAMKKGSYGGGHPRRDIARGETMYPTAGGNRASITPEVIQAALRRLKAGGGKAPSTSTPSVNGTESIKPASNNQWWDLLDIFPNQENTVPERPIGQKATLHGKPVVWDGKEWVPDTSGNNQENTVPERPIGQKATLNGEPVVWDGKDWVPDSQAILPIIGAASILRGVLALPPGSTTFGLSPLDQNAISAFLNAIQTGGLKLFLAPEGLGTAASILQAGGALVDGAGNLISGAVNALDNAAGELFGGGGAGGNQASDPTAPSEKPILEDPIGEAQKYLEPQEADKILWSDIQNNWYGNKNLSIEDGINIFRKKIEQGGKYKTADDYTGNIFKDIDILFGGSKETPSKSQGGPLPNNLPGYFLGKVFKSVGNFFKGVVNTVKKAVSGIGSFLSSPLGSVLTTVLSVAFPAIAPIVSGIKAVVALSQGDIVGAIVGGVGALGGMFPGTFGAEGTFWGGLNDALGEGLGGIAKGFLTGGFGGAIGALPGIMPEGMQAVFRGIGGFMEKYPGVANVVQMLPGLAGVPGFDGMLGMPSEPGMPGMGGLAGVMTAAASQGAGGVLNAIMGGITGTQNFQSAIPEIAAELGVKSEALGGTVNRSKIQNPLDEKSREYALQTSVEITQVPIVIERLVEIPKPVPINNYVPVKQPAPPPQPAQ